MARITFNKEEYKLIDFDTESDLEKAVIENKSLLFGQESIYLNIKKSIGDRKRYHSGIADAFLIDFGSFTNPQLYIVENELSSHDLYAHINEQIARFAGSATSSSSQIRQMLLNVIHSSPEIKKEIENKIKNTIFKNIEDLMIFLTEKSEIKIVIVINEITNDLNLALKIFRNPPDVVLLQRYQSNNNVLYYYEPMREELEDLQGKNQAKDKPKKSVDQEFDTIVCAALPDGFKRAYQEANAWWEIRLSQEAREKIRYLAIYEKSPKACIEHVAEVERIEPYKDSGKYIVYLKNKRTIKSIPLDKDKNGAAPQSPRYTTFEKLQNAKVISELWE